MLNYILLWLSNHRDAVLCTIGFSLWVASYTWYAKRDWDRWHHQRRTRKWSADMVSKTSKGGYGST